MFIAYGELPHHRAWTLRPEFLHSGSAELVLSLSRFYLIICYLLVSFLPRQLQKLHFLEQVALLRERVAG